MSTPKLSAIPSPGVIQKAMNYLTSGHVRILHATPELVDATVRSGSSDLVYHVACSVDLEACQCPANRLGNRRCAHIIARAGRLGSGGVAVIVPTTVAEALDAAADLQERRPWGQGAAVPPRSEMASAVDPICAGLAIQIATRGRRDLSLAASRFFREQHGGMMIADWNDVEGRTKAEVVAELRAAAVAAREARR